MSNVKVHKETTFFTTVHIISYNWSNTFLLSDFIIDITFNMYQL